MRIAFITVKISIPIRPAIVTVRAGVSSVISRSIRRWLCCSSTTATRSSIWPSLPVSSPTAIIRSATGGTPGQGASALRLARAQAIARNADVVLAIDADRRLLESPAMPPTRIDADIAIAMTVAAPERRGRGTGAIRFFPDGTSSGGDIILTLGARHARIEANWLTGDARLDLSGDGAP